MGEHLAPLAPLAPDPIGPLPWLHWPVIPWPNSVQGFKLAFEINGTSITRIGKATSLWDGFHQKHDVLNCSYVARCDAEFMSHVLDGHKEPCGQDSILV